MRSVARWGTLPLLAAPVGAWGLGLGDIELQSALNQPFRAEIEVTATAEELESLEVSLANEAAFERYGLFRAGFLSSLDFEVTRNAAGESLVVVTSNESITEPFVTMLLEASWARGRVLREYTALLDPPSRLPGPEGPVPVQTPESGGQDERTAGGAIERERTAPAAPRTARDQTPSSSSRAAERPAADAPGTYGPVQRGETLWALANEFRPSGVSTNQMLVGLYRANPEAFDGNMNLLRRGAILRIPAASELGGVSASAATAEVSEQIAAWQQDSPREEQQARLRLVPPSEDEAAAGSIDGGESAETQASAAGAGGDEVAELRGQVESLESDLDESQRIIELRDEQLANLQRRLAELEDAVEAAEPTPADGARAGLESEPLFADEAGDDESPAAAGSDSAAGDDTSASAGDPAAADGAGAAASSEASASAPAPAAAADEPSVVSRVLGWFTRPLVWIGLGIAAVLLAGLGYARRRRAELDDVTGRWETFEAEVGAESAGTARADYESTSRLRRQVEKSEPDFVVEESAPGQTGTFDTIERSDIDEPGEIPAAREQHAEPPLPADDTTLSNQTVINLDQADPVAEADFHMAYGLYDQAADLMTTALESDPRNRAYKLKLLEVYFVWGNEEAFLETSKELRGDMGGEPDADWDKVIIMGKQICPDEPMFAEARAAAGAVDLDLDAGTAPDLDFAFGDASMASDTGGDSSTSLDDVFGGDDSESELVLESERESAYGKPRHAAADADMLQLGETTAAGLDAAFAEDDDEAEGGSSRGADVEGLETTQESPTVEQPRGDDDEEWSITTQESPTIESPEARSTTMEVPAGDEDAEDSDWGVREDGTSISQTLAVPALGENTSESPTVERPASGDTNQVPTIEGRSGEFTAELELDDLGLDVSDFDSLPEDLGDMPAAQDAASDTREQPAMNLDAEDDKLLSATGVTHVLREDDETGFDSTGTSMLGGEEIEAASDPEGGDPSGGQAREEMREATGAEANGDGIDFDFGDMRSAFDDGDTVEQPQTRSFDTDDIFSGNYETPVDLDVGSDAEGEDEPTDASSAGQVDPQTMTEVGTKLDLARAYIDMGDPEGARSILEEVLDEGDSGQRHEARTLLDTMSA